jgi:hypothetical protein
VADALQTYPVEAALEEVTRQIPVFSPEPITISDFWMVGSLCEAHTHTADGSVMLLTVLQLLPPIYHFKATTAF